MKAATEKEPTETDRQRLIQIRASERGDRLFRNNVGVATFPGGERVAYGLFHGSSDLIGPTRILITPEMVGRAMAIFTAVEVKKRSSRGEEHQEAFLGMVRGLGGIAGVARTVEEYEALIEQFVRGA